MSINYRIDIKISLKIEFSKSGHPGRGVTAIQRKIMQDKRWMRWNYINQAVNAVKKP